MKNSRESSWVILGLFAVGVLSSGAACSSDENGGAYGGSGGYVAGGTGGTGGGAATMAGNSSTGLSGVQVIAENDANGDGMLSPVEAPSSIGVFDAVDTNGDGLLTAGEIDQASASTAGSGAGDEICTARATGTRLAPKIVLVLDGSSSMTQPYGNTDRWSAMRGAMVDPNSGVVATMEGLIEFGLVIFAGEYPGGGGECPIPGEVVGPALNNYAAIQGAFPTASPGRYTPTGEALDLVCESMPGVEQDMRPQYVILATDGQPNSCQGGGGGGGGVDYQSVIDAANLCCSKGVTIYVISLASGGPEYEAHLQDVANIGACTGTPGGSAPVYSPQDPGQLANDLGQLMGGALTCEVRIDGTVTPGKECDGSVVLLNGSPLLCNDPNGWILVNESTFRLQGTACESFRNDPNALVTATFPCDVFVPGEGDPGEDTRGPIF